MCAFSNDSDRHKQSCKVDFFPNFATGAGLVRLSVWKVHRGKPT